MKVGDLVRTTMKSIPKGTIVLGIVIEAYDTPKGIWRIHWMDGGAWCSGSLCHENNMEKINKKNT